MHEPASAKRRFRGRGLIAIGLWFVIAILYVQYGQYLHLDALAQQETALREFQRLHPVAVYGLAFAAYVAVTGMSLPGATALTLVYAWYFGFLPSLLLVSIASTSGATVALLLSRFLFRDVIQRRWGDRLQAVNSAWEREGPYYLFSLRLIPLVPFFVVNALMGLTTIPVTTFWWVSQLGMFPGTAAYVYAGSRVPRLQTLAERGLAASFTTAQLIQLTIAFAALGLLPIVLRRLIKRPAA